MFYSTMRDSNAIEEDTGILRDSNELKYLDPHNLVFVVSLEAHR